MKEFFIFFIVPLINLATFILIAYVAIHFIIKYW